MRGSVDTGLGLAALAGAVLCGAAWQLQQPGVGPVASMAVIGGAALGGLLALIATRWSRRPVGLLAALLLTAVAAFAWTDLRASWRLAEGLDPALEGQDAVLVGTVAAMPQFGATGTRFVFEVEARADGAPVRGIPRRLALGWYHGRDDDALPPMPSAELRAGDRWRLPIRLRLPHGLVNPHGFDLELWLFEQGLRAGGTVRAGATRLGPGAAHPVERLRQSVRDAIVARVPDTTAAGVLAALAVGDQAAIDRDAWDLFRDTGVAHLMSISGLHVTMFAWLGAALVRALWRWRPTLGLRWPAPTAARLGGLLFATAYAVIAGWGVPAQRTVLMIAVIALSRSAGVRWPQPAVLLASAVVVTLADPWALMQPGFWLSFVAVAMLIASEPVSAAAPALPARGPGRAWHGLRQALRAQAVATIGLAPLTLVFFQQVSLVGFVANLAAIPLVTLVVTPMALLGVLLPPLWTAGAMTVHGLVVALQALAAVPGAVWTAAAAPAWAAMFGLAGGALLLAPLPWRLRVLGLPMLLPLLDPAVPRPPEGRFEFVAADVGQGTAALVRTRQHLLVYDAGPMFGPDTDAGQRVLVPLLRGRGERRVDLLVLSHRDADHVGGAASLLSTGLVVASTTSLADDHPLRGRLPAHRRCDAGQRWTWDGVEFEVLHPLVTDHAGVAKPNALSCVLRVQDADGHRLLLTGDIEAAQEAGLTAREPAGLKAEVLLVPHHGSRTSSTAGFLAAVAPRVAVVQAGYRSRFGHPAPDVVQRYETAGIQVRRTDRCGAWTWASGETDGRCERSRAPRYWHHPGHEPGGDPG